MKIRTPDTAAAELIPLSDRLRYMRLFRLVAAAIVLVAWLALPQLPDAAFDDVAIGTAAYALATLAVEGIWRISGRRALALFGALLIADGLYFAWVAYVLAPPSVPLEFLVVVHLVAVSLLASFRTGLKLAFWHSLLMFAVFHAREAGIVPGSAPTLGDGEYRLAIASVVVYWVVAIVTASFAAVNERELRRRRYDLEVLARLALRLERETDVSAAASALIEAVTDELGFERAVLFDLRRGPAELLAHHGTPAEVPAAPRPSDDPLIERLAADHRTRLVSRVGPGDDAWIAALLPDHRDLIMVPLIAEDRPVALLVCEHGFRRGSRAERRVVTTLERFASHTALAINNAWLLEQLESLAATDSLTGVANRRTFDSNLWRELARASRSGESIGLVMVDIDRFKLLNDTHGHGVGDQVLQQVAQLLDVNMRAVDTAARLGGEEFGLILPGLDAARATAVAERMRALIAEADFEVPVTASFGVAAYPADADDPDALMKRADGALYESKENGRNRVTSATPSATDRL